MWGAIISAAKSAMDKRGEEEEAASLMSPDTLEALEKYKTQQAARENSERLQAYGGQHMQTQLPQAGGYQVGIPQVSGGQIPRMPQGAYQNDPYTDLYKNGLMGTR